MHTGAVSLQLYKKAVLKKGVDSRCFSRTTCVWSSKQSSVWLSTHVKHRRSCTHTHTRWPHRAASRRAAPPLPVSVFKWQDLIQPCNDCDILRMVNHGGIRKFLLFLQCEQSKLVNTVFSYGLTGLIIVILALSTVLIQLHVHVYSTFTYCTYSSVTVQCFYVTRATGSNHSPTSAPTPFSNDPQLNWIGAI